MAKYHLDDIETTVKKGMRPRKNRRDEPLSFSSPLRQNIIMRATVDLNEDVLLLAKKMAEDRKQTLDEVISDSICRAFNTHSQPAPFIKGLRVIKRGPNAKPVTLEIVNRLRDEN